jgi:hypothetical protein
MARLPVPAGYSVPNIPGPGGFASYRPGVGAELSNLGQVVGVIAEQQAEKLNSAKVEDAYNQLLQEQLELTMGEERGFTRLRSREALDANIPDAWGKQHEEAVARLTKGMNAEQMARFTPLAQQSRLKFNEKILSHLGRETEVYQEQVYEGKLQTAVDVATSDYLDIETVRAQQDRVLQATLERAEAAGMDAGTKETLTRTTLATFHGNIVQAALDEDNVEYATAYFKSIPEGEMTAKVRHQFEQQITERAKLKKTQYTFDSIVAKHPNDYRGMREAAKNIKDPEIRKEVTAMVDADLRRRETQRQLDEEAYMDNIFAKVETQGYDALTGAEKVGVARIMPSAMSTLRSWGGKSHETTDEGWQAYTRLVTLPPEELAKVSPYEYRPILGDTELKELTKLVSKARQPGSKSSLVRAQTLHQKTTDRFKSATGKDPKGDLWAQFNKQLQVELEQYQQINKAPMPPSEEDALIDYMLTDVVLKRGVIFDDEGFLFQVETVQDIPEKDRDELRAYFIGRNGRPPTEDELVTFYRMTALEQARGD